MIDTPGYAVLGCLGGCEPGAPCASPQPCATYSLTVVYGMCCRAIRHAVTDLGSVINDFGFARRYGV